MDIKSIISVGGKYNLNRIGVQGVTGQEEFKHILASLASSGNIITDVELPWKKIDFDYSSTEELLEQISKRYDMEKLEPCELSQVLNMLKEGGVISSDEYWLGQSVIPVVGSTSSSPMPADFENALKDYYSNFETFVDNNAHLYSPKEAQRLHDSVLVHKKIETIFKQIQSYR